ncbi:hypothetical protein QRQ56_27420 [Bradyrhizobium sp. U531]|uniref:hypothetical protein n=1 Tax=Bradyrhizobium sp. U531 TaxID=3053458 RepID=UPI003F433254
MAYSDDPSEFGFTTIEHSNDCAICIESATFLDVINLVFGTLTASECNSEEANDDIAYLVIVSHATWNVPLKPERAASG